MTMKKFIKQKKWIQLSAEQELIEGIVCKSYSIGCTVPDKNNLRDPREILAWAKAE